MEKDSSSSSQTNEFEFGSMKPALPSSDPRRAVSPADEFFVNGRLLPHSFPIEARTSSSTRRTSSCSISSKDSMSSSLVSSRSSSASSSGSSTPTPCASARTSSSDVSERKVIQKKIVNKERLIANRSWRFIITPGPVLGPSVSRRKRSSVEFVSSKKKMIKEIDEDKGFCKRIFRSFVKSCKACHAMEEGAAVEDNDLNL